MVLRLLSLVLVEIIERSEIMSKRKFDYSGDTIDQMLNERGATEEEQQEQEDIKKGSPVDLPPQNNLEEAANLLLSQLTDSVREFALEVADVVLKVPRWQLVLGSLLAQYQSGTLPSPWLDPSWRKETMEMHEYICANPNCSTIKFEPKRFGQIYCSNNCAIEHRRAGLPKREDVLVG